MKAGLISFIVFMSLNSVLAQEPSKNLVCQDQLGQIGVQILVYKDKALVRYSQYAQEYQKIKSEDQEFLRFSLPENDSTLFVPFKTSDFDEFYHILIKGPKMLALECELLASDDIQ